jgi:hypothetical protein
VVAEDGEVMIRKEAVRAGGLRAALAFNQGRFDVVIKELLARFNLDSVFRKNGGMINPQPTTRYIPMPQMLASGGAVSGGSGASIRHEHTLHAPGGMSATVYSDDLNAERFISILQNAMVSSS